MSRLGTVRTDLGPVTLHHRAGRFETRRTVRRTDGTDFVSVVILSRERAREWYRLALANGATRRPFPGEVRT